MRDSRPRTLVRLTFANPASLVYLGLVAVAALPVVAAAAGADVAFAGIWLLMITAPTSMVLLLPDFAGGASAPAAAYIVAALVLSALLHSFVLGLAYRGLRGHAARRTRPAARKPSPGSA
ncbi:SCO4225 family membrane protein [Streptomyces sp. NPDC085466]|uniref:SCO4225 family membrane protein n=1 Tax=Streptomyces sp. NPDC085466 TaxID=3365725 RepID=UPI0037D1B979